MRTNNQKCRCVAARSILAGLLLITCFSGCAIPWGHSASGSHDRAFIDYWPPKENKGLRLAVKDNIDMKGVVTTAGSEYVAKTSQAASRDAKCLAIARERNVQIVGKTNLSEFAVAPSDLNEYYGTPKNPFSKWRRLIPGGASSGSAVAAADGLADVAFGTDTAGSIRVPAACCGIVGLKTTFGLVSLKGVLPVEPKHLDTVGPMAKDVDHVVQGMDLLQNGFATQYRRAVAAKPLAKDIRIGRLYLSGTDPKIDKAVDDALAQGHFQVIALDKAFTAKWDQAKKDGDTLAAAGAWINYKQYFGKLGVSAKTEAIIALGELEYATNFRNALQPCSPSGLQKSRFHRSADSSDAAANDSTHRKNSHFGTASVGLAKHRCGELCRKSCGHNLPSWVGGSRKEKHLSNNTVESVDSSLDGTDVPAECRQLLFRYEGCPRNNYSQRGYCQRQRDKPDAREKFCHMW